MPPLSGARSPRADPCPVIPGPLRLGRSSVGGSAAQFGVQRRAWCLGPLLLVGHQHGDHSSLLHLVCVCVYTLYGVCVHLVWMCVYTWYGCVCTHGIGVCLNADGCVFPSRSLSRGVCVCVCVCVVCVRACMFEETIFARHSPRPLPWCVPLAAPPADRSPNVRCQCRGPNQTYPTDGMRETRTQPADVAEDTPAGQMPQGGRSQCLDVCGGLPTRASNDAGPCQPAALACACSPVRGSV